MAFPPKDEASTQEAYQSIRRKVSRKVEECRLQLHALLVPQDAQWHPVTIGQPQTLFQVVASVRGELLSVFDGHTTFELGRWSRTKQGACSWPPLAACFVCSMSAAQARAASVPAHTRLQHAPKVLMEVQVLGKAYFNAEAGVWAASAVRPLRLIAEPAPLVLPAAVELGEAEAAEQGRLEAGRNAGQARAGQQQRRLWVP